MDLDSELSGVFDFTIFYLGVGGTISACLMPELRN